MIQGQSGQGEGRKEEGGQSIILLAWQLTKYYLVFMRLICILCCRISSKPVHLLRASTIPPSTIQSISTSIGIDADDHHGPSDEHD